MDPGKDYPKIESISCHKPSKTFIYRPATVRVILNLSHVRTTARKEYTTKARN